MEKIKRRTGRTVEAKQWLPCEEWHAAQKANNGGML